MIQMLTNWWLEKMVYPYSGILFTHKKERSTDTCNNIDKPEKHFAKWKKSVTKDHIFMILLMWNPRIGKPIETEGTFVLA